MQIDPEKHHRRSLRLRGYDYAQEGAYFVTICTHGRQSFFDEPMLRTEAESCWLAIPEHVSNIELDEWVVMPNHLHGIIVIVEGAPGRGVQLNAPTLNAPTLNAPTPNAPAPREPANPFSVISPRSGTLSVIVRTYKAAVTSACRGIGRHDFAWQRNYYEHIVRNERELNAIREYICNNPLRWSLDLDNPANFPHRTSSVLVSDYLREAGVL